MLEGNPAQEGPFTMRLHLPDGFKIQPHSHLAVEHLTVISGTFNLGMGEKFDTSVGRALPAGGFAFMPPGMKHFAWAKGETVVQVHGMGPWKIYYVNISGDDCEKEAWRAGVKAFLRKPEGVDKLCSTVTRLLEERKERSK